MKEERIKKKCHWKLESSLIFQAAFERSGLPRIFKFWTDILLLYLDVLTFLLLMYLKISTVYPKKSNLKIFQKMGQKTGVKVFAVCKERGVFLLHIAWQDDVKLTVHLYIYRAHQAPSSSHFSLFFAKTLVPALIPIQQLIQSTQLFVGHIFMWGTSHRDDPAQCSPLRRLNILNMMFIC